MGRSRIGLRALFVTFVATGSNLGCSGETRDTASAGSGGSGPICSSAPGGSGGGAAASGTAGTCGCERITVADAKALYTTGTFDTKPEFGPPGASEVKEVEVAGLWENLGAQLFDMIQTFGGTTERVCTVLYHGCRLFMLAGRGCSLATGPAASGLVARGAFYFSWEWGSGIVRTQFGKLRPNGPGLTRIESAEYINELAPGPLVIKASGSDTLVYRSDAYSVFNEWTSSTAEYVGKLKDAGDRLTVVDDSGQEIATMVP